jgi:hypothetical protein
VKEKDSTLSCLNKLTPAVERIMVMILIALILSHVSACLWYFVTKMEDFNPQTWVVRTGYTDSEIIQVCFFKSSNHFN